jgi:formylglycine-generating enzyme required for sulfatase activity
MLRADVDRPGDPGVRTAWVTAWKYDRHEALWRVMILSALDALWPRVGDQGARELRPRYTRDELADEGQRKLVDQLARLEESVYRPVDWQELGRWTVDWLAALQGAGMAAAEIAAAFVPGAGALKPLLKMLGGDEKIDPELEQVAGAFQRQVKAYHREQLVHMEQFEHAFGEALELAEVERLVVFVDDLDRCLPEKAIEVLEAIKLFLEVKGAVFVLGMDREVVERGVQARYREWFGLRGPEGERLELPIRGDAYLQKMVQIPFHLPPLTVDDVEGYIETLETGAPDEPPSEAGVDLDEALSRELEGPLDETTRAVLARGLYPNPRQVKRALNVFRLLKGLVLAREQRHGEPGGLPPGLIAWPLLAKTLLIQHQWPELYRDWRQYPTLVRSLEEAYARQPVSDDQIILGQAARRAAPRQVESRAEGEEGAEAVESAPAETTGGLLASYLTDRRKYALLERLLTYPPGDQVGEGRARARFAGLKRAELEAYLLSVSAALEGGAPEGAPPVPQELRDALLSGDTEIVVDALERFVEAEPEESRRPARRREAGRQLVSILEDPGRATKQRLSAGEALARAGDPRFDPQRWNLPDDSLLGFMPVEAGPFLMGSDPKQDEDALNEEQPQHEVHLPSYYIARYPTTVAQFRAFIEASGHQPGDPDSLRGADNHPVVLVSWHDAIAYCRWLDQALKGVAPGIASEMAQGAAADPARAFWRSLADGELTVTLPSEAEWEKAARGTDGRIYPWGNEFDPDKANTGETGLGRTSPVGCFPGGVSPYGLLDMSGNAWEWTRSLWGEADEPEFRYPYHFDDGRENLEASEDGRRVVRGGGFDIDRHFARCAFRGWLFPRRRVISLGFRVVLALSALGSGGSGL